MKPDAVRRSFPVVYLRGKLPKGSRLVSFQPTHYNSGMNAIEFWSAWIPKAMRLARHRALLLLAVLTCISLSCQGENSEAPSPAVLPTTSNPTPRKVQEKPLAGQTTAAPRFDGERAYHYLRKICSFGNRRSGSLGMRQQQQLVDKHFQELGGEVQYQRFRIKHPVTGERVPLANLIVHWQSEAKERILLCAHYDSRPFPDREADPRRRKEGVFLGANDGASGVAVLMELGHHVGSLPKHFGLDFVLFDAEEFVFEERLENYFIGSRWFATQYVKDPPKYRYVAGVLLDMVGDEKLSIYQERYSATWPDTRPIVKEIWDTASRLGVDEFIPQIGYPEAIRDDHLPLHQIAKIPVCDVIDFEYPGPRNRYWHTTADAPGRCSAESLGKVGWVIYEWLASKR